MIFDLILDIVIVFSFKLLIGFWMLWGYAVWERKRYAVCYATWAFLTLCIFCFAFIGFGLPFTFVACVVLYLCVGLQLTLLFAQFVRGVLWATHVVVLNYRMKSCEPDDDRNEFWYSS